MWDRRNLREALEEAGFVSTRQVDAHTSDIPGWDMIRLDLNCDGSVYKPGSLFVETRKPGHKKDADYLGPVRVRK